MFPFEFCEAAVKYAPLSTPKARRKEDEGPTMERWNGNRTTTTLKRTRRMENGWSKRRESVKRPKRDERPNVQGRKGSLKRRIAPEET
jgi:hypothetical protein